MMGDQSFQYLTMDDMKIMKDDSVHPTKVIGCCRLVYRNCGSIDVISM